jgi:predicted nucleotidyltransferase
LGILRRIAPWVPGRSHSRAFALYEKYMNRQDILARLKEKEAALRARGVLHAALFGSRARGDNRPDSDIDIMIELDPDAHIGVYDYVGLKEYIAECLDASVDVVSREGLKPYIRPAATADAIYAF